MGPVLEIQLSVLHNLQWLFRSRAVFAMTGWMDDVIAYAANSGTLYLRPMGMIL